LTCSELSNIGSFGCLSGNQTRNRTETATGHTSERYGQGYKTRTTPNSINNMIFERGHFQSKRINESRIKNSLNETKIFSSKSAYSSKPAVFLSHKHDDFNDASEVIGELV
jgi:hypothetical protein